MSVPWSAIAWYSYYCFWNVSTLINYLYMYSALVPGACLLHLDQLLHVMNMYNGLAYMPWNSDTSVVGVQNVRSVFSIVCGPCGYQICCMWRLCCGSQSHVVNSLASFQGFLGFKFLITCRVCKLKLKPGNEAGDLSVWFWILWPKTSWAGRSKWGG